MKVYIVFSDDLTSYASNLTVVKVFKDCEKAEKYAKERNELEQESDVQFSEYFVREFDVVVNGEEK